MWPAWERARMPSLEMPSMQQTVATRERLLALSRNSRARPQTGPGFVDFLGWKSIRNSLIAVHYAAFKRILLKSEPWADDAGLPPIMVGI